MTEPRWLTVDELIELNRLVVGETGEPFLILSQTMLESAANAPYHHWAYDSEEDVSRLSVMLMFALARDHPFEQGNKRTGFVAATAFLAANGYDFDGADSTELAELIIAVIGGDLDQVRFQKIWDRFVKPVRRRDELH